MSCGTRLAGVALPLSAIRGNRDSGIGELTDLPPFAEWAASLGQRVVGLLPLGESAPGEASPYSAMSSFAIDPLHVSVADLPELGGEQADAASVASLLLHRERVFASKRPRFEHAFAAFEGAGAGDERRRAFESFRAANAEWLDDYALFRALGEERGSCAWPEWPEDLRERDPAAIAAARDRLGRAVAFYAWLQFVADDQWRRARARARAAGVVVYGDLPFAPSLASADVWSDREAFDVARTAGAPPDAFSQTGQRWGLPMFAWPRQRASGWRWLRARMRRMRDLYDLVRIDHVVGLFRAYGYRHDADPGAFDPADEPAQIAQGREILSILRDEAAPARLVAEDLGVIPPFVRETLRELDLPGYKIFRWELDGDRLLPPAEYPECSLATTGTHDTDTLASWWRSADAKERAHARAALAIELGEEAPRLELLRALWESPSRLVVLPIQDLFGWADRVNVPATVGGTNWRWRLPVTIAELPRDAEIARLVRAARR